MTLLNDAIDERLSHTRYNDDAGAIADEKLLKQCQSELAKREGANKELLGALEKIASGTEDDLPPFRAMPRQNMQVIAQTALAKHKVES